ncbi:hypothetical protein ST47_g9610 [Ascochyta rabiei]|uniref:Uncharacterized protein n=1 Tax=Didymella rabiei TaxID=5454 RepID=A0A162WW88_DIDRA|nr:hypothetical protein ST47_g9610 [Ascochyta rabiei]
MTTTTTTATTITPAAGPLPSHQQQGLPSHQQQGLPSHQQQGLPSHQQQGRAAGRAYTSDARLRQNQESAQRRAFRDGFGANRVWRINLACLVEGTALLARLRCLLPSFAGDLGWDKRAGTAQRAQSHAATGVRHQCSSKPKQSNSRLRDLCCPIRWQLRLRRDAPLSPGHNSPSAAVLYTALAAAASQHTGILAYWHTGILAYWHNTTTSPCRLVTISTTPALLAVSANARKPPLVSWNRRTSAHRVTARPVHSVTDADDDDDDDDDNDNDDDDIALLLLPRRARPSPQSPTAWRFRPSINQLLERPD